MYNVSQRYLNQVLAAVRDWDLYIDLVLQDDTHLKLTRADIELGSFTLKEGATCSDTIQIGSTFSNSVEFRIINSNKRFNDVNFYGAKIYPYVGLLLSNPTEYEYVPLGEFNILDNVKKFSTISITGFDNMSLMTKVFDFSSVVFPTTPVIILDAVVEQCGLKCSDDLRSQVSELTYTVSSLLTNDPTCRDVLAGIGIMLLKNLRFDRLGVLESFWYSSTSRETTKSTRVGNSSYNDNQIEVTGVYLEDAYGNVFSEGTDTYPIELPSSPIIQGADMAQSILVGALDLVRALPYSSSTITWVGDPAIQVGDIVDHKDTAVGDLSLPVMRLAYKFAGTETLESVGLDSSTNTQQTSTDRKFKRASAKASQDRKELESKIDQSADQVLVHVSAVYTTKDEYSQLDVQVGRIGSTVAEVSKTTQELKEKSTSIEQRVDSVSISVTQVSTDLSNKVDNETFQELAEVFTFNEDGMTISNTGTGMGIGVSEKRVVFTGGENPTTEIYPDRMKTTNLYVGKQLDLGDFSFIPRTNGNLSFRYTGGN